MELDNLAMCTQKTNFLNPLLKAKVGFVEFRSAYWLQIIRLLRDFGNKKDVERYARYVMQRQRSRSSTELPRVLSSAFVMTHDLADSPAVIVVTGSYQRRKRTRRKVDLIA